LPVQQEVGELRCGAGEDLAPQQSEAAALDLLKVRRRRPQHRLALAGGAHRHGTTALRPRSQSCLGPGSLERVALQKVIKADQRVRVEESRQNDFRSILRILAPLSLSPPKRG